MREPLDCCSIDWEYPCGVQRTQTLDGLNRRIEKEVPAGSVDTHYYYYNDEWQMLEEPQVNGQGATVESNDYVWSARYIDSPIVRFHDDNGDGDLLDAGDATRYYTTDANHNVTAVIDAATGTVATYYTYTPQRPSHRLRRKLVQPRRPHRRRPALLRLLLRRGERLVPGPEPVLRFEHRRVRVAGSGGV